MKIKYLLLPLAILAMFATSSMAQSSMDHYKKVYKQALAYGDFVTAANAIYDQWVDDPADSLSYEDTLANLYFIRGQYYQSIALSKNILAKHPDDGRMLELQAASLQNVNDLKDALDVYQKIYNKAHDLYHLYQIASLQYGLQRLIECQQSLNTIISDTGSARQKIQITVAQGQAIAVPYRAAAYNILGVIQKNASQTDAAKKSFQAALDIDKDFILAKNNLDDLNGTKATGTGVPATKAK